MSQVSDEKLRLYSDVKGYLLGSCNTEGSAAEVFGIDDDEVLDACVHEGISVCSRCDWWHEDNDMNVVNSEFVCEECLDEDDEIEE